MRLLKLALIPILASGVMFARGGGGGGGGGRGGGGFGGGGMRGGGGFGGGMRGGGFGGGGFRGGGFGGGGFRGGGFGGGGFRGGGFRGGFGGRGFGFGRGFGSNVFIGGWGWPGWGWGWGWPGWGWGGGWGGDWGGGWPVASGYPGCDPYWGCQGGGYVDPGYGGVAGYPQQPPVAYGQPSAPPVIINQSFGATDAALGQPGQASASFYRAPDYFLIAFNDHTIRAAVNYHVVADTIVWTTREGQQMKAPLSSVDVRFSQQINRDRRVDFRIP